MPGCSLTQSTTTVNDTYGGGQRARGRQRAHRKTYIRVVLKTLWHVELRKVPQNYAVAGPYSADGPPSRARASWDAPLRRASSPSRSVTNPPYKRFPDPRVDDTGDPSRRGNHAPSPVLERAEYACAQHSVRRGRRAKALALQHRARHTTPSSSLATTRRPRPRACERATRCPVPPRKNK
jgi:hypothetical protein